MYVGQTGAGESIQRIAAHAKKMGCGWLASCSSVKGKSIDKAGDLEEGLCLERALGPADARGVVRPCFCYLGLLYSGTVCW